MPVLHIGPEGNIIYAVIGFAINIEIRFKSLVISIFIIGCNIGGLLRPLNIIVMVIMVLIVCTT
jgi:hypothetical protein